MPAELHRRNLVLKVEHVWTLTDMEPVEVGGKYKKAYRLDPRGLHVTLYREAENAPYVLYGANLSGVQYKESTGEPGLRYGDQFYRDENLAKAPEFVRDLVAQSLAEAERERLGDPARRKRIAYAVSYLLEISPSLGYDETMAYEALRQEYSAQRPEADDPSA